MKITAKEIAKVKLIAYRNFIDSIEDAIGFEFNGQHIINPWMDSSGRFELTDEKAIEYYGLENVLNFILNTLKGVH